MPGPTRSRFDRRPVTSSLAVAGGVGAVGLSAVIAEVNWPIAIIVSLVTPLVMRSTMTATLGPAGVKVSVRSAAWESLEIRRHPLSGTVLATRREAAGRRPGLALWAYERNWRQGQTGAAIRRWRPDLLPSAAPG